MSTTPSILIVDDQLDNLKVLTGLLKQDYRVRIAASGTEALGLIRDAPAPDLILLDIMMPGMDGYAVCEALKQNPKTRHTPVIFLTAKEQPEDEARGFAVGGIDYVIKPAHPPLLQARVKAQLALAQQLKRSREALDASHRFAAQIIREREEHKSLAACLQQEILEREQAEAALRESQARLARLGDGLRHTLFFFTSSLEGELRYLSEGFTLLGLGRPEHVLGWHWRDLAEWSPESLSAILRQGRQLFTGKRDKVHFELSYRDGDGDLHDLEVYAYRIHDVAQALDLIEGVAIDITERKQREGQLRTLSRVVEQAPVSITVTDPQANIIYVNPYFSRLTGYRFEEVIGQNTRLLKSGENSDTLYQQMWQTLAQGETWRGEMVNKRKDGSLYWVATAISPIFDNRNKLTHYVAVKANIADRKELERVKEDVDRIMRHDLKSPLTAIMGFPDLLLMDDNLTSEQREYIGLIREAGQKMQHIINLSLDLFKMETGQYHYEPHTVNIVPILDQLTKIQASGLNVKSLTVQCRVDGAVLSPTQDFCVRADARLLFSLLSNLFLNAIEASPTDETIYIDLNRQTPAVLTLSNRGAVPAPLRQHFFEKYKTHGKKGGTGLGTYSAKLMADTMGFGIAMETSDEADLTRIRVTMPAADM